MLGRLFRTSARSVVPEVERAIGRRGFTSAKTLDDPSLFESKIIPQAKDNLARDIYHDEGGRIPKRIEAKRKGVPSSVDDVIRMTEPVEKIRPLNDSSILKPESKVGGGVANDMRMKASDWSQIK